MTDAVAIAMAEAAVAVVDGAVEEALAQSSVEAVAEAVAESLAEAVAAAVCRCEQLAEERLRCATKRQRRAHSLGVDPGSSIATCYRIRF